jgi:hypothetical protein
MSYSNPAAPEATTTAIVHEAGNTARDAAGNAWVGRFMRFGQFVRGVIYVVLGTLALRLALGTHGAEMTETGVIELIGQQRFGVVLLVVVAIGLASYALWGVIRAVFDPLHKGKSALGITKRIGFAASGLAYAGLVVITLGFIVGPLPHISQSGDWTARLLAKPFGAWLIGFIGVCWIAVAGIQIVRGWQGKFIRDLDLDHRAPAERRWAIRLGRIGIVTQGIVFTIIGVFLVATAFRANPHHVTGMDGALLGLLRQPFGRTLVGAAGLGLLAFGVFSAMCARWMRIDVAGSEPRSRLP